MRDEWDAEDMCGAAGLLNLESASAAASELKRMADAVVHRGPERP